MLRFKSTRLTTPDKKSSHLVHYKMDGLIIYLFYSIILYGTSLIVKKIYLAILRNCKL